MEGMTLDEYYDILDKHDWFYEFSDDSRVYGRGVKAKQDLLNTANQHGQEYKNLYDAFKKYHFSGKPWGTEEAPKPEKP